MTDADALLAAILADPADDTVRLAYADHLDESDQHDRAEFIRDSVIVLSRHTDCPTRLNDLRSGRPVPLRCGACGYCSARQRAESYYSRACWMTGVNYAVAFEPTPLDGPLPTGPGLTLVVSRGFVSEVTCDFATLFGGPCGRCRGQGRLYENRTGDRFVTERDMGDCPTCDGKGHTPGVAAELFRRHPVQGVTLVGLEPRPVLFPNNRQTRYVWDVDSRDRASPSTIPHALWEDIRSHESAQAAKDWLSTKCVRLGRERAKAANTNQGGNNDRAQGG